MAKGTCSIVENGKPCEREGKIVREWCLHHYHRWYTHGDPLAPVGAPRRRQRGWGTPEYIAWRSMKHRCLNANAPKFHRYGGRGISICARWVDSFPNFLDDMGLKPSPSHSLDRIDNDGNYEPGNCRWATRTEQARNRSSNRLLEWNGTILTMAEWSERTGITRSVIQGRIDKSGWSVGRALTTPVRGR